MIIGFTSERIGAQMEVGAIVQILIIMPELSTGPIRLSAIRDMSFSTATSQQATAEQTVTKTVRRPSLPIGHRASQSVVW